MSLLGYLDCSSGISGDMLLAALIDAGVPPEEITKGLPFSINIMAKKVKRGGIMATEVEISGVEGELHSVADFQEMISKAGLSETAKEKALQIIHNLFEVEASIHGESLDKVHLHELGSIDTIIDIVGTLRGLEYLGIKKVYCSAINTGKGYVNTSHGIIPVPAPATLELLKGFPIYSSGPSEELTTPTGAAILKAIATPSDIPLMRLERISYGAGARDLKDWPNLLRLLIGEESTLTSQEKREGLIMERDIFLIESNIDDMNPQFYEYLMEVLFEKGALDVYIEDIMMKKSRPGQKISVLCREKDLQDISALILRETTSLGLRFQRIERYILPRRVEEFSSTLGRVRLKIAQFQGIKKIIPEYEDIKRIAREKGLTLSQVMERIKEESSTITWCP